MKALSADLRERICDAIAHDALATYPDIAARFAVSLASVERLARKRREGRSLVPGVSTGRIPKVGPEQRAAFEQLAASRTKWTLRSLADAWQEQTGVTLSLTTVSRLLKQCDFTYKKKSASLVSATSKSDKPSARP